MTSSLLESVQQATGNSSGQGREMFRGIMWPRNSVNAMAAEGRHRSGAGSA